MPLVSHADGTAELQRLIGQKGDSPTLSSSSGVLSAAPDDAIRLTPDRTRILRLDQDAASVIVTNPAHASVVMDNPRLLVVMPREPGTTSFTVLDREGKTILERNVIVTGAQQKYVRVRRMCAEGDSSCTSSAYYYCPDGCYEVRPVVDDGGSNIPPVASANAPASSSDEDIPVADEDFEGDVQEMQESIQNFIENMPSPPVGPGMEPER
jgi:hypothetical protein